MIHFNFILDSGHCKQATCKSDQCTKYLHSTLC